MCIYIYIYIYITIRLLFYLKPMYSLFIMYSFIINFIGKSYN